MQVMCHRPVNFFTFPTAIPNVFDAIELSVVIANECCDSMFCIYTVILTTEGVFVCMCLYVCLYVCVQAAAVHKLFGAS